MSGQCAAPKAKVCILLLLTGSSTGCGPEEKQALGSTVWAAQCEEIVPRQYQACYGPGRFEDGSEEGPHFNAYRVSVDRIGGAGSSISVFERELSPDEVDPRLMNWDPQGVVFFNSPKREVLFRLGRTEASYTLP